jgi:hypothetical protein
VSARTAQASAFEEVVADWCDRHGGYVEPGTTRPYLEDKRYRACAPCFEQMRAAVAARERYCSKCNYLSTFHVDGRCPRELEARAAGGDR